MEFVDTPAERFATLPQEDAGPELARAVNELIAQTPAPDA